jgi:hypothetical protein
MSEKVDFDMLNWDCLRIRILFIWISLPDKTGIYAIFLFFRLDIRVSCADRQRRCRPTWRCRPRRSGRRERAGTAIATTSWE